MESEMEKRKKNVSRVTTFRNTSETFTFCSPEHGAAGGTVVWSRLKYARKSCCFVPFGVLKIDRLPTHVTEKVTGIFSFSRSACARAWESEKRIAEIDSSDFGQ